MAGAGAKPFVDAKIKQRKVLMFSKRYSPECKLAVSILQEYKLSPQNFEVVEIECRQDCNQIEDYFQTICQTDSRAVPQLFIGGTYVGGEKEISLKHESGELEKLLGVTGVLPDISQTVNA